MAPFDQIDVLAKAPLGFANLAGRAIADRKGGVGKGYRG